MTLNSILLSVFVDQAFSSNLRSADFSYIDRVARTNFSKEWVAFLRRNSIDARSSIAHDMTAYFPRIGLMPCVKNNSARVVSVPIYPALSEAQVNFIVLTLRRGIDSGLV